jgi:hypothetical protein
MTQAKVGSFIARSFIHLNMEFMDSRGGRISPFVEIDEFTNVPMCHKRMTRGNQYFAKEPSKAHVTFWMSDSSD